MDELAELDGMAQAELVLTREVSSLELVDAAISRIETLNPSLNCVVTPLFERARQRASEPASLGAGPLAGVPYLLKDLGATRSGVRQTWGSRALRDHVPTRSSAFVRRLEEAGVVFLGVASAPEAGNHSTTEPALFGPTRNPWNTELTSGGSSGGSAAAVAARMVPIAHASDGGGSIRIPASCCGVFGLKPTRGRVSWAPEGELLGGLAIEHAVTVSVRDSAALLDIEAGPEPGDPYFAPPPETPYLDEVALDPTPLRIAWSTRAPLGIDVHPDCERAVKKTVELLLSLGHEVEEGAPTFDEEVIVEPFLVLWSVGNLRWFEAVCDWIGRTPEEQELEITTWELIDHGRTITGGQLAAATESLHRAARDIAAFYQTYDVWVAPTLAQPPEPLGVLGASQGSARGWWLRDLAFNPWNGLANMTGQPSMSLPLHWTMDGLPIGVLVTGRYAEESTMFRLAGQLEEARPWRDRRPPARSGR